MKKRLLSVLLVAALAASMLVGCGGSSEGEGNQQQQVKFITSTSNQKQIRLGRILQQLTQKKQV